jgi:transposase
MARLRFVQSISEELKEQLNDLYAHHPHFRCRQRAHAILLSSKGYTIAKLQDIFEVDRDTVSSWFDRFESQGIVGLEDMPKSGRPPIYTDEEINHFKELIDKEPRQIKKAQALLQQTTNKNSCTETLKRALKKN